MSTPNKVIQVAQQGYYVLELCDNENGQTSQVIRHPVIAWAFDTEDHSGFLFPEAITLGGNVEAGSGRLMNAVMLCPDGRIRNGTDADWESESHFLQEYLAHSMTCKSTNNVACEEPAPWD